MVELHPVQKFSVKTVERTTQNCDRTSIRLKNMRWHKCVRGKDVTKAGWHGFSCLKNAGRFSRHSNLKSLIKQSLPSTHIPSVEEPRYLYRTDQKRSDGLTLVSWAVVKQLLWDVTIVDYLTPSTISAGSVCNPGRAATEAQEQKK